MVFSKVPAKPDQDSESRSSHEGRRVPGRSRREPASRPEASWHQYPTRSGDGGGRVWCFLRSLQNLTKTWSTPPYAMKVAASPAAGDVSPRAAQDVRIPVPDAVRRRGRADMVFLKAQAEPVHDPRDASDGRSRTRGPVPTWYFGDIERT